MARFFSDEDFPLEVVSHLRRLRHDVVTIQESGLANRRTPDLAVLEFAVGETRAVLTMNRRHFVRLHQEHPDHHGIFVCTADENPQALAERIDHAAAATPTLTACLVRISRPS